MKLITLTKYIFKAKWTIKLPKKNKFVLVDGEYNPFLKYINNKDITILYRRGEEIYFPILLKCFFKLKFSPVEYCAEFIKHVSPKLILSLLLSSIHVFISVPPKLILLLQATHN